MLKMRITNGYSVNYFKKKHFSETCQNKGQFYSKGLFGRTHAKLNFKSFVIYMVINDNFLNILKKDNLLSR